MADETKEQYFVQYIGTLSGNYPAHGEPLDFTTAAPNNFALPPWAPSKVWIEELTVAGSDSPGYQYKYNPGPTLNNPSVQGGVIQIFGTGAASGQGGTQFTAGAYSNGTPSLNNQQLLITAMFQRG